MFSNILYHKEEQRKLHVDKKHCIKVLYNLSNTVHMKLMLGSTLPSARQVLNSGTTQVDGAVSILVPYERETVKKEAELSKMSLLKKRHQL